MNRGSNFPYNATEGHSMGQTEPPLDERQLERDVAGDNEAVAKTAHAELYCRHREYFHRVATRLCGGDEALRDDVLQDHFIKTLEKRKKYNPDKGPWRRWATAVLRNIIMQKFRKRRDGFLLDDDVYEDEALDDAELPIM